MTAMLFRPPADVRERLEWAKSHLGREHVQACIHLLEAADFPTEDAKEIVLYGLATSYLVAADEDEETRWPIHPFASFFPPTGF
ncbi:MAG: hypothetical protein ABW022_11585 [Actinoplanes sp.]